MSGGGLGVEARRGSGHCGVGQEERYDMVCGLHESLGGFAKAYSWRGQLVAGLASAMTTLQALRPLVSTTFTFKRAFYKSL
jgi:hypothetical protein